MNIPIKEHNKTHKLFETLLLSSLSLLCCIKRKKNTLFTVKQWFQRIKIIFARCEYLLLNFQILIPLTKIENRFNMCVHRMKRVIKLNYEFILYDYISAYRTWASYTRIILTRFVSFYFTNYIILSLHFVIFIFCTFIYPSITGEYSLYNTSTYYFDYVRAFY
jgi:hypothetical protein